MLRLSLLKHGSYSALEVAVNNGALYAVRDADGGWRRLNPQSYIVGYVRRNYNRPLLTSFTTQVERWYSLVLCSIDGAVRYDPRLIGEVEENFWPRIADENYSSSSL